MGKKTREKGAKKEKEEKIKTVKSGSAALKEARERPTSRLTNRRTHTHERDTVRQKDRQIDRQTHTQDAPIYVRDRQASILRLVFFRRDAFWPVLRPQATSQGNELLIM